MLTGVILAAAVSAAAADIVVAVSGVPSAEGRVHVDICTRAQFLDDCALWGEARAVPGTTLVTVANVPSGTWAAQAFLDRNMNGRVDRGLFGIPREPLGFSNDVRVHLSAPGFAEAAFVHGAAPQRIALTLHRVP